MKLMNLTLVQAAIITIWLHNDHRVSILKQIGHLTRNGVTDPSNKLISQLWAGESGDEVGQQTDVSLPLIVQPILSNLCAK